MKNYSRYLLPSKLEEDWGFYVTTVGHTKIDAGQAYPLNRGHPDSHKFNWDSGRILDGYYLVFISMGEGVFESAQTASFEIKGGTCFLLFPGTWHRYKPQLKSGWEEYWVGFKGRYPELLMGNFDPKNPFIKIGRNDKFLQLFHSLIDQVQQGNPGYHQLITGLVLQILAMAKSASHDQEMKSDRATKLVEEIKFLLREAISSNLKTEQILHGLPAGYSKLRRDFKKATGAAPHQYLLGLRLEKVKILLSNTELSISEIAYQTGFESASYLSKLFKKKNKCGPKEWRKDNEQ